MARKFTARIDGSVIGTRTSQYNRYTHAVAFLGASGWWIESYHTSLALAQKARDAKMRESARWIFKASPSAARIVRLEAEDLPAPSAAGSARAAKAVATKRMNRVEKTLAGLRQRLDELTCPEGHEAEVQRLLSSPWCRCATREEAEARVARSVESQRRQVADWERYLDAAVIERAAIV